jgi:hypothetical protein
VQEERVEVTPHRMPRSYDPLLFQRTVEVKADSSYSFQFNEMARRVAHPLTLNLGRRSTSLFCEGCGFFLIFFPF